MAKLQWEIKNDFNKPWINFFKHKYKENKNYKKNPLLFIRVLEEIKEFSLAIFLF